MKEYVESAKKVITSTTQKVVGKSGVIYSTTKLSLKITKLKAEADECYKKIGEIVYANYKGTEVSGDEAETLCAKIEKLHEEIDVISAQIAEVKGALVCSNCGAEIRKGSSYCAKCGTEI